MKMSVILQPPSRGCVLKHQSSRQDHGVKHAAAFARLCVETINSSSFALASSKQPPSRGCVLKQILKIYAVCKVSQPPSRGCVLKLMP